MSINPEALKQALKPVEKIKPKDSGEKPEGEPMLRKVGGYWNPIKDNTERKWVLRNGTILIIPSAKGYLGTRAYFEKKQGGETIVYQPIYFLTKNDLVVGITNVYSQKTKPEREILYLYTEAEIVGEKEDELRLEPLEKDAKYHRAELTYNPQLSAESMKINYQLTAPQETPGKIIID